MVYATEQYEIENASEREPTDSDVDDEFEIELNSQDDLDAFFESEIYINLKIEVKQEKYEMSIHEAAILGRIDIIQDMIKDGTSINLKDEDGWTPLMLAAWNGEMETVKFLIENNASMEEKSRDECTAADHAESRGHSQVAEYIVSKLHPDL